MKIFSRAAALLLAAVLALPALPARASDWLIPKTLDPPEFSDTRGTICEDAASICFQTGLMTGVDAKHFMPQTGLSNAQIIVISARLHRLLKTGSVGEFDSYHLPKDQWWNPYDAYLQEQIPGLAENGDYASMREGPGYNCSRQKFLMMLAEVLDSAGTALPDINDVGAVPDCTDESILRFYRAGILGGKDGYGTLVGSGPLSRAAAAAMLARLIDPAQRLQLDLMPFDLCQELLGVEPDTVLFSVGNLDVTAEQLMPALSDDLDYYNHSRLAGMAYEQLEWVGARAVDEVAKLAYAETLARDLGLDFPALDAVYYDNYKGLTASGQAWDALHRELLELLPDGSLDAVPEIRYAGIWHSLPLAEAASRLYYLPYWRRY